MNPFFSCNPAAVITDIDGTLTDERRRISTAAIECIRTLTDAGIPVILASGNTLCSMTMLAKMIGTDGTVICENGGTYRIGFNGGDERVIGNISACRRAFSFLERYFEKKGRPCSSTVLSIALPTLHLPARLTRIPSAHCFQIIRCVYWIPGLPSTCKQKG